MSEWIDIKEREPEFGQVVTGVGYFSGEVHGAREGIVVATGKWFGSRMIDLLADSYDAKLMGVTHWMPAPELPEVEE